VVVGFLELLALDILMDPECAGSFVLGTHAETKVEPNEIRRYFFTILNVVQLKW